MDRIQELLSRITDLSDDELNELKDLILQQFDDESTEAPETDDAGNPVATVPTTTPTPSATSTNAIALSVLEELAEASTAVRNEFTRREDEKTKRDELAAKLQEFKGSDEAAKVAKAKKTADEKAAAEKAKENAVVTPAPVTETPAVEAVVAEGEDPVTAGGTPGEAVVPDGYQPRPTGGTTVIRAGADLPGFAMGSELNSRNDLATAMVRRITSMRGIRTGDGDKMIVASASLDGVSDARQLLANDAEGNFTRVQALIAPEAIVAAGGLAAPEEVRYELFGVGDTDRPVRSALPVFTTERGGVRFMRPPTLADVQGVVGIWTVPNDLDAVTNINRRKPSFRVLPGPEIVVDTQAITMIMTFGNMTARAYPELVARHNELGMIAHARVAEQQLLTQIGALSTQVTGRTQRLGAIKEVLMQVSKAAASYRNRSRISGPIPLKAIMPIWFQDLLRADLVMQHPGDGLDAYMAADTQINQWFSARNINITWSLDGEAGQDYASIVAAGAGDGGSPGIAEFPTSVIWYLFAEGTFAFMDGGTLDLGLVRDSTLNAANDYQMFVETFENVVKFGNESLRVSSPLIPTGQGSIDRAPYAGMVA